MIRLPTCPICRKSLPLDAAEARKAFPFCSARCRQIDFFRWMDGRYAIVEPLSPEAMERAGLDPESLDPESLDSDADPPDAAT